MIYTYSELKNNGLDNYNINKEENIEKTNLIVGFTLMYIAFAYTLNKINRDYLLN